MTDENTIQDSRLEEIAKAAAEINTMNSEEALEAIVEGINKVPEQLQAMIDSIVAIQFDWPMPEEGWRRFVEDVERTNKRLGLDLRINLLDRPDSLNVNSALEEYAKSIDKTRDELSETDKMQAIVNAVLAMGESIQPINSDEVVDLEAIRKRLNEATTGPWYAPFSSYVFSRSKHTKICQLNCKHIRNDNEEADSKFIAHSYDDIRGLLSMAGRLEKVMKFIQEQAGDEGLWFIPQYATEVYLQEALRRLHAVIEGEEQ